MGKKAKSNATYFFLDWDTHNHRKVKVIRAKYGIEGYAVYVLLLQLLTHADGAECPDDPIEIELIAADWGTQPDVIRGVLDIGYNLGLFEVTDDGFFYADRLKNHIGDINNKRDRDRTRYYTKKRNSAAKNDFSPAKSVESADFAGESTTRVDKIREEENKGTHTDAREPKKNENLEVGDDFIPDGRTFPLGGEKPANDGRWHEQEFVMLVKPAWIQIQTSGRITVHEDVQLKNLWIKYNTEKILWGIKQCGDRKPDYRTINALSRFLSGEYSTEAPKRVTDGKQQSRNSGRRQVGEGAELDEAFFERLKHNEFN